MNGFSERAVELPPGSQPLVRVLGQSAADRFVWQTAGRDTYEALIGDWLHPPRYLCLVVLGWWWYEALSVAGAAVRDDRDRDPHPTDARHRA